MQPSRVAIICRNCVLKGQILDQHILVLHLHYSVSSTSFPIIFLSFLLSPAVLAAGSKPYVMFSISIM